MNILVSDMAQNAPPQAVTPVTSPNGLVKFALDPSLAMGDIASMDIEDIAAVLRRAVGPFDGEASGTESLAHAWAGTMLVLPPAGAEAAFLAKAVMECYRRRVGIALVVVPHDESATWWRDSVDTNAIPTTVVPLAGGWALVLYTKGLPCSLVPSEFVDAVEALSHRLVAWLGADPNAAADLARHVGCLRDRSIRCV